MAQQARDMSVSGTSANSNSFCSTGQTDPMMQLAFCFYKHFNISGDARKDKTDFLLLSADELIEKTVDLVCAVRQVLVHRRDRRESAYLTTPRKDQRSESSFSSNSLDRGSQDRGSQDINMNARHDSSNSLMRKQSSMRSVQFSTEVRQAVDEVGNETVNQYTILAQLGTGVSGEVFLATNDKDKLLAIKRLHANKAKKLKFGQQKSEYDRILDEIHVMKRIKHPNCIRLYEVIDDPQSETAFLVMQYAEHGPVVHLDTTTYTCTPLPFTRGQRVMQNVIKGLRYLHTNGIIHCDIKPDNILLGANDHAYLADFGVSMLLDDDCFSHTVTSGASGNRGTTPFMPPERFDDDYNVQGPALDVWSLGVTLYCTLFGRLPFTGDSFHDMAEAIKNNEVEFPNNVATQGTDLEKHAVDLIKKMLEKKPLKRLTLEEIAAHPFVGMPFKSDRRRSIPFVRKARRGIREASITRGSIVFNRRHRPISVAARSKVSNFVTSFRIQKRESSAAHLGNMPSSPGLSHSRNKGTEDDFVNFDVNSDSDTGSTPKRGNSSSTVSKHGSRQDSVATSRSSTSASSKHTPRQTTVLDPRPPPPMPAFKVTTTDGGDTPSRAGGNNSS